jgi:hypothetical protein
MGARRGDDLLRLPVRLRGIQLGRPYELLIDLAAERAVGFEIVCGDEERRFLPLATATLRDDEIALGSALTLLEEGELAFYRDRASALSSLRGMQVERDGRPLGRLVDVLVGDGGTLAGALVEVGGAVEEVAAAGLRPRAASAA